MGAGRWDGPGGIGVATDAAALVLKAAPIEDGLVGCLDGVKHGGAGNSHDPSVPSIVRNATRRGCLESSRAGLDVRNDRVDRSRHGTDIQDIARSRGTTGLDEDEVTTILASISTVRASPVISIAPLSGQCFAEGDGIAGSVSRALNAVRLPDREQSSRVTLDCLSSCYRPGSTACTSSCRSMPCNYRDSAAQNTDPRGRGTHSAWCCKR